VLWDEALARAEMHYEAERVIPSDRHATSRSMAWRLWRRR
jgi:hypothetical protein